MIKKKKRKEIKMEMNQSWIPVHKLTVFKSLASHFLGLGWRLPHRELVGFKAGYTLLNHLVQLSMTIFKRSIEMTHFKCFLVKSILKKVIFPFF